MLLAKQKIARFIQPLLNLKVQEFLPVNSAYVVVSQRNRTQTQSNLNLEISNHTPTYAYHMHIIIVIHA